VYQLKTIASTALLPATALAFFVTFGAVIATPSFAEKAVTVGGAPMYPSKNIIDNAVNSKDHTTLVAAVKAAGLVDTLSGKGPFTVFAPTDAAFAKLPPGTVEALLKDKAKLTQILTYHVVAGELLAKDLVNGPLVTVQGQSITIKKDSMGVMVNDAKVIKADVMASNGVIHVIDTVLLPK
jgi:uncharacterized surface protein with fasciclin (FAS1) repeats